MTRKDDEALLKQAESYSQEVEGALNLMLEETIRSATLPNAIVWIGTVVGAFLLNLGLLALVAGS